MKFIFLTLLLLFSSIPLAAIPLVNVQAEIESTPVQENRPIKGMISITHNKSDPIDLKSMTLEGQPLTVELTNEVEISPPNPLIISYYRFTLPEKPVGLYVLPQIQVKVAGKLYSSIPSTYEVKKMQEAPPPNPVPSQAEVAKAELKLHLQITGTPILYPKQRFRAIYHFYFNTDIELTEEHLPLLEPIGFSKVGTKKTKEYTEQGFNVQELSQQLEAIKPGEYTFDGSSIEGYAYNTDYSGKKVYLKPLLKAEMPSITLNVAHFPTKNKPASFNEAIGPFSTFKVSLESSSTIHVGDKILLKIEVGGDGQIDNVPLPELCCQPGFSGVFQLSDLPPSEKVENKSKLFMVELRALTALVHEIPSLEFSYFDPKTGRYGILKSDPLPLTILPIEEAKEKYANPIPPTTIQEKPPIAPPLPPIEILGNWKLQPNDLYSLPFGTWKVFWIIPLGVLLMGIQIKLKKTVDAQLKTIKIKTSSDYFKEALTKPTPSTEFYLGMSQAFLCALKEKGIIAPKITSPEQLKTEGMEGEVRALLSGIEKGLFGGLKDGKNQDLIQKARDLFKKIC